MNKEHYNILRSGVDKWNAWRRENLDVQPNLIGADLSRANLWGANLSRANLSRANLWGANFNGAIFTDGWVIRKQEKK